MLTFAHTHELDMMPGELDFAATQTYERNYSGRSRTTGY